MTQPDALTELVKFTREGLAMIAWMDAADGSDTDGQ